MTLRHLVFSLLAVSLLAACTVPRSDMKSPCVGAEGSPCGPHRPVNDWWLNSEDNG